MNVTRRETLPKRSNSFQRLVVRLQNALHDEDCTIEESAMVQNHISGNKEEIDILVTFEKGDNVYRAGIACRDHSRPAGPSWIRDLASQRDHCRLDKVIAFHSNGFSGPAKQTAEAVNISTFHIDEIPSIDIGNAIGLVEAILTTFVNVQLGAIFSEHLEQFTLPSQQADGVLQIVCAGQSVSAATISLAIRNLLKYHCHNSVYNGQTLTHLPISHSQISLIRFRGIFHNGSQLVWASGEHRPIASVCGYAKVHSGIRYPRIRSRYNVGGHTVLDAESHVFGRRTELLFAESIKGGSRVHINAQPGADLTLSKFSYDTPKSPSNPFVDFQIDHVSTSMIVGVYGDIGPC